MFKKQCKYRVRTSKHKKYLTGYTLIGSPKSTCESDNGITKWSKPTPYCKGYQFKTIYSCMV